jgi:CheY-like chemotaxis protein
MSAAEDLNKNQVTSEQKIALVVDDNNEFNRIMSEYLGHLGYVVKQCHDGNEASRLVRDEKFNLIMLDIRIPSVNGLQVAALARASKQNRSSNIFIITGEVDPIIRTKAEALKIKNFLNKPVDFAQLESMVKDHDAEKDRKTSYDVRVINAFIEAAAEVYEFHFGEKPQRGKVHFRASEEPQKGFCTSMISLTGDGFGGSMGISMTAAFIKRLALTLFQDVEVKFDNEFVSDLAGEICNQIMGRVKINFAKLGLKITIGLPDVIMGKDHIIHHKVPNPVICVAMGRDKMVFELQFVLSHQHVKLQETSGMDIAVSSVIMFE